MTIDAVELLAEQRRRWEAGTRTRVEVVIGETPGLSDETLLDLIYNEIVLRKETGDVPSYDEYAARFPAFADPLRLQFPVHEPSERAPHADEAEADTIDAAPSVPGYVIDQVLGRGGMGVVYAANQTSLGRRVAIKILPASASSDREALARFESEARTASSLDHPNVATIYDFGTHAGQPFIVMELVVGQTLAKLVAERPAPERSIQLVRQAAQALAAAHAADLVHRDLKPANLMVRDDGIVKVLDFGLAHARVFDGTPRYMSPEQLRGEPAGPPSDVYSLGLVLYELLYGRLPTDPALASGVQLPRHAAIVGRMLEYETARRPTMEQLVTALDPVSPTVLAPRRAAARRLPLIAAALAIAIALGAALALATRRDPVSPAAPRTTPSLDRDAIHDGG